MNRYNLMEGETTLLKYLSPLGQGSIVKEKNSLPFESKVLSFRVNPLLEGLGLQEN